MDLEKLPTTASAIHVPAPTGWPMTAAFGFTLILAGLITHPLVSVFGMVTLVMGLIGWFRAVLPQEAHEAVPVELETGVALQPGREVRHLQIGEQGHRARLPLEVYPYSAGIRGGLVGGAAMALLAILYGLIGHKSIWYPINLLAASVYAQSVKLESSQLHAFHADSFAVALFLHLLVSTAVGLLYGAMLPMFAHRPIILGGLIGPVLWSGLLYSMLSLLNPMLESHIDWVWFIASQVAFGVVAGFVVVRQPRVPTRENISFALRAGVEAPGMMPPRERGERP